MFNKYLTDKDILGLPFSGNLYFVSVSGKVLDNKLNEIPTTVQDGEKGVFISWIDGYKFYKTSFLVACTFKPLRLLPKYFVKLSLLFKDGNKNNIHPANLIWKFPKHGLASEEHEGFFFIPCYTSYVINKEGKVIQQFTKREIKDHIHKKGYHYFNLSPDLVNNTATTIGRHRIFALVFLDYSEDVDEMEVNHENGIPGDDRLNNLEWVTKKQNIIHAFKTGLRSDNKTVIVKNHNTGEISKYFSAHECERALGLTRSVVHYRIKNSSGKVFPSGLSFEYDQSCLDIARSKKPNIRVSVLNTLSGQTDYFDSLCMAATATGISKKTIARKLLSMDTRVFKGFVFKNI